MTQTDADRLAELTAQETRFVFDTFDHATGWQLGTLMVERALHDELSVIIDIAGPGSSSSVRRWPEPSPRTRPGSIARPLPSSGSRPARLCWPPDLPPMASTRGRHLGFDTATFAPAGGSVPIRVGGAGVIGAVTVSGLTSDEDHDFTIAAIETYLAG